MKPHIEVEFFHRIYEKNRAMMSFDKLLNLYYAVIDIIEKKIPGDFVELGSYKGYTAICIQKILKKRNSNKAFCVFDSFQGLPEKGKKDLLVDKREVSKHVFLDNRRLKKGWFKATKEELIENFQEFQLDPPKIYEGWFEKTLPKHLPKKIAFAHLDADFYSSTYVALEQVFPRLSKGAIVILDDYCDPKVLNRDNSLPGVKKACDEFFKDKKVEIAPLLTQSNQNQAILVNEM